MTFTPSMFGSKVDSRGKPEWTQNTPLVGYLLPKTILERLDKSCLLKMCHMSSCIECEDRGLINNSNLRFLDATLLPQDSEITGKTNIGVIESDRKQRVRTLRRLR